MRLHSVQIKMRNDTLKVTLDTLTFNNQVNHQLLSLIIVGHTSHVFIQTIVDQGQIHY